MWYFIGTLIGILVAAFLALLPFYLFLFGAEYSLNVISLGRGFKFVVLMLKSLRRNLLRTSLSYLAIFVLVVVVTGIWSILAFLNRVTEEKSRDLKAIVTERWQIPSQMPRRYAHSLSKGAPRSQGDVTIPEEDSMTWQFYGGNTVKEREKQTRETLVFFFAMDPEKFIPMMDGMDEYSSSELKQLAADLKKLETNKRACVLGRERMEAINKRVGETFTIYSLNYKGIDLEFEIVGQFPEGRYNQSAVMNRRYLDDALDDFPNKNNGQPHPMAEKSLNLVWLRVPDTQTFQIVANQIMTSPEFTNPSVKCETASSGISSFLDAYRDLIWGMRWLLSPAILATMALVVANAISISVRERRAEMAVLKVLGFKPWQVLFLILGEALLIGAVSGFLAASTTQFMVNEVLGGLKFPIAFFPSFFISGSAWWWGLGIGTATALVGSLVPAVSAMKVKVSDVFAKVA